MVCGRLGDCLYARNANLLAVCAVAKMDHGCTATRTGRWGFRHNYCDRLRFSTASYAPRQCAETATFIIELRAATYSMFGNGTQRTFAFNPLTDDTAAQVRTDCRTLLNVRCTFPTSISLHRKEADWQRNGEGSNPDPNLTRDIQGLDARSCAANETSRRGWRPKGVGSRSRLFREACGEAKVLVGFRVSADFACLP